MAIHSTIAHQILQNALLAGAKAGAELPAHVSPAIREAVGIRAAIAHVAADLHDVPESSLYSRVLISLAQEATMAQVDAQEPPELGPCEWFLACRRKATHLQAHLILGQVPACDECPRIGR